MANPKILKSEPFDPNADYSSFGDVLETISAIDEPEKLQSKTSASIYFYREKYQTIDGNDLFGKSDNIECFRSGEVKLQHCLARLSGAEILSPNGVVFINNGTIVLKETTWQSRIHLHPYIKSNKSTAWKLTRNPKFVEETPKSIVDRPVIAAFFRMHFQYYHWFIDCLPRIWLTRELFGSDVGLLAGFIQEGSVQHESLELLGFDTTRLIYPVTPLTKLHEAFVPVSKATETLKVRPSFKDGVHYKGGWDSDYLAWANEKIRHAVKSDASTWPRRIFVDRSTARHRRLLLDRKFCDYLLKKEFAFVDPGQFSFFDQARIFYNAEVVIGPHGAGLTNIIWTKQGVTKIIEFFPEGFTDTGYSFISNSLRFHHIVVYSPRAYKHADIARDDILIDSSVAVEVMEQFL